jgi:hypothetical protein
VNYLTIPPCPYRPARGDAWPRHKAKARNQRANRRRTIADLAKEQLEREKINGIRV